MYWLRITVLSLIFVMVNTFCFAQDFPFRKDYPEVPTIELADLKAGFDDGSFIIVDVRSSIEFDTIHPKGSFHVSLSKASFGDELKGLAAKYPNKKIALYCNGVTCLKSYKGVQKALDAGIKNVYAFDAGIPAWVKAYPADTLLVGKQVTDPDKQIIPKSEFEKRTVDFETFKRKAESSDALVIDARDPIQRVEKLPGFEKALPIPLNKLIENIINKERKKDKQLLIFDQVGKQVRWVMYHLEDKGYKDYYFLSGGATEVLKEQKYR